MFIMPDEQLDLGDRPASGHWSVQSPVPKYGWVWQDYEDTGLYPGPRVCQMCLQGAPRFLHSVNHPDDRPRLVGGTCAAWMTCGSPGVITARALRNAISRMEGRRKACADAVMGIVELRSVPPARAIPSLARLRTQARYRLTAARKDAIVFPAYADTDTHEQLLAWLEEEVNTAGSG